MKGIVYLAIGEQYLNEAIVSATSIKRLNSKIQITLFTLMNLILDHFREKNAIKKII